ncbi:MAG: AI-2E family transporter [Lachnospiraceae bacterium]|nr:AI-2E family transporter [Lachnospiraceae bacterium]
MKFNIEKKYITIGITAFFVFASAICFYYLIFHSESFYEKINSFFVIASPVIYGVIVAYLLTPIVNFFEKKLLEPLFTQKEDMTIRKKKYMRMISVTMTMIVVIIAFYGFFSIVIPNLVISIRNISSQFSSYVQTLNYWSKKFFDDYPEIEMLVVEFLDMYSGEFNDYLNNSIIPQIESLVKTVSLSLISVLKFLWNFIIGVVIAIYVLFSKETFAGQAKKIVYAMFSTRNANQIISDTHFISETFIGFISGKIVDSVIIGFLCFAGTSFLKLPYPLLISVIVGVTNVIPFFGPYLGAIPCAILVFMVNPVQCIYFVIFVFLLQQLDGNVIGPKILGESTGLSGFWVIFSITIFGGLWGVPGMIIGVPVFAVIYAMTKRHTERKLKKKGLPIESDKYLNVKKIDGDIFVFRNQDEKKRFFKFSFMKKTEHEGNKLEEIEEAEEIIEKQE